MGAVLAVHDLARGAALARHAVALHHRGLRALGAGGRLEHAAHHRRRLGRIDLHAGGIAVALDQRKRHHVAVAREHRVGASHLQQRDGQAVAVGHGGLFDQAPAVPGPQAAGRRAGKADLGRLAQAQLREAVPHLAGLQLFGNHGHADVAGLAQHARHVQRAVAAHIADGAALVDEAAVAGFEQRIRGDAAQVQRQRRGKGLHDGARLERVRDGLVAQVDAVESVAVVRVEGGHVGQRQDLARVHVQHHGGRALGLVLFHRVLQLLEHEILQARVDGQAQVAPVHGRRDGAHVLDDPAEPVLDDAAAAGAARQLLVERQLDAFLALVLDAVEPDHVGHHVAVRIVAAGFGKLVYAGQVHLLDLVGHVHGHLALQVDEVLVLVHQAMAQVGRRHFQQLGKRVELGGRGLLGILGNGPDGARRHAGGEHHAVTVQDLAARGGQGQSAFVAALALLLQELGGQPLEEQRPAGQHDESAEQQDQHQARAPGGKLPAQHGIVEERHALHCAPPAGAGAAGWLACA